MAAMATEEYNLQKNRKCKGCKCTSTFFYRSGSRVRGTGTGTTPQVNRGVLVRAIHTLL